MTEECSLRCSYCIENFNKTKFKKISDGLAKQIIDKFDYLLSNKRFLDNYSGIRIAFWGGEPTTCLENIKKFTGHYKDNDKVSFFMYSNGYEFKNVFSFLEEFKDIKIGNEPKFLTQISYDGLASHDTDRLTLSGKGSGLKVKQNIFELAKRNIPFIVHPTIAHKNFDKIALNYFEFKRMSDTLNVEINYNPTIDYMSKYNFTSDELARIINTLKNEFIKIKDDEVNYYKANGYFRFGWMNPNKAICSAGDGYSGINLDGYLSPCHGVFNEPSIYDKLTFNKVSYSNYKFLTKLLNSSKKYHKILSNPLPDECKNCLTHYCLKCNSTKCSNSDTKDLKKAWIDYTNQPDLCQIYKFIGKYRIALIKYIESLN